MEWITFVWHFSRHPKRMTGFQVLFIHTLVVVNYNSSWGILMEALSNVIITLVVTYFVTEVTEHSAGSGW